MEIRSDNFIDYYSIYVKDIRYDLYDNLAFTGDTINGLPIFKRIELENNIDFVNKETLERLEILTRNIYSSECKAMNYLNPLFWVGLDKENDWIMALNSGISRDEDMWIIYKNGIVNCLTEEYVEGEFVAPKRESFSCVINRIPRSYISSTTNFCNNVSILLDLIIDLLYI